MNILRFLATRYLSYNAHRDNVRGLVRLCYFSIWASTAALLIVLAIMHGFEVTITHKLSAIQCDGVIHGPLTEARSEKILSALARISPLFDSYGPRIQQQCFGGRDEKATEPLMVVGLDQEREKGFVVWEKVGVWRAGERKLHKKEVLIGRTLARNWGLWIGSPVTLAIPEKGFFGYRLRRETFMIAGIFTLGLDEFDAHAVAMSYDDARTFFRADGPDRIVFSLARTGDGALRRPAASRRNHVPAVIASKAEASRAARNRAVAGRSVLERIKSEFFDAFMKRLNRWYTSYLISDEQLRATAFALVRKCIAPEYCFSWHERYPDLAETLAFEKYVMSILFTLFLILSLITVGSVMVLFLKRKEHDRVLLLLLGATRAQSARIFSMLGWKIIRRGLTAGVLTGGAACAYINHYKPFTLPGAYYVTTLPAILTLNHVALVVGVVLVFGWLMISIPLRIEKRLTLNEVLKK